MPDDAAAGMTAANAAAHVAAKPQEDGFELSGREPSGIEAGAGAGPWAAHMHALRPLPAAPLQHRHFPGTPPQHAPLGAVDDTFRQHERSALAAT